MVSVVGSILMVLVIPGDMKTATVSDLLILLGLPFDLWCSQPWIFGQLLCCLLPPMLPQ